ncbi:MAG: SurA N-terminal domain-containing protein [Campylobacterales bacterium]
MQRHKKWLIITIWVSTIAFIGAGFVGWGSFDYSGNSGHVAKVGSIKITNQQFNDTYGNIYNYYNRIFGGKLDREQAKKMGLEQMALQTLINQALFENFAHEMGIQVTDEEVSQKIVAIEAFTKNGVFDKEHYRKVLSEAGLTPQSFEASLKKDLLIEKVQKLLQMPVTKHERRIIEMATTVKDRISMSIIHARDISITLTPEEIKAYWEKNKNSYKTEELYDLALNFTPITETNATEAQLKSFYEENKGSYTTADGKLLSFDEVKDRVKFDFAKKESRKKSLVDYVAFKEGKIEGQKVQKVSLTHNPLPPELNQMIATKKEGETLKPVEVERGFVSVKILKKYPARLMSFEEAAPIAEGQLRSEKARQKITEMAAERFRNWNGTDIGFIGRQDASKLPGFNSDEASKVIAELFASKNRDITVLLADKAVLLRIMEQKLLDDNKSANVPQIEALAAQTKEGAVMSQILKELGKRYPVEIFYQPQAGAQ